MPTMTDARRQVVTGLVPPQQAEALIREVWPSVAAYPAVAGLGSLLMRLIITAPLAWLMLAPFYFFKILPFVARRYTLTNRRLMIQRGLKPRPVQEVALAEIETIQVKPDGNTPFFRAANLEVLSKGKVVLTLKGVPGAEAFRQAILSASKAWAPVKA
jgi:uncharacterized membrane protein YdbT with pleckstrin-like domain